MTAAGRQIQTLSRQSRQATTGQMQSLENDHACAGTIHPLPEQGNFGLRKLATSCQMSSFGLRGWLSTLAAGKFDKPGYVNEDLQ